MIIRCVSFVVSNKTIRLGYGCVRTNLMRICILFTIWTLCSMRLTERVVCFIMNCFISRMCYHLNAYLLAAYRLAWTANRKKVFSRCSDEHMDGCKVRNNQTYYCCFNFLCCCWSICCDGSLMLIFVERITVLLRIFSEMSGY